MNSIVIVLFLTGMVAMILIRALHKDISRYNAVEAQEDVQEDYGWKLVHGDVFRPPQRPMLLSVLIGSGAQITAMTGLTLGMAYFFEKRRTTNIVYSVCCFRFLITFESWCIGYSYDYFLHGLWLHFWICFCTRV